MYNIDKIEKPGNRLDTNPSANIKQEFLNPLATTDLNRLFIVLNGLSKVI